MASLMCIRRMLTVEGRGGTELSGICGRCLIPIRKPVEAGKLCLNLDLDSQDKMDISEDIRAELLLELPMLLYCSDECRGLCPVCGYNLNESSCSCPPPAGPSCWNALDDLKL